MYINIVHKGNNEICFSDIEGNTLPSKYVLGLLSDNSHVIYKRVIQQQVIDGESETPFSMISADHYMIIASDEYQNILFQQNVKRIKENIQRNWFKVVNFINRIKNNFWNSRSMNSIKEFLSIGMNYPEFLYCDETEEYISDYPKSKVITSLEIGMAKDFHKLGKLNKYLIKKSINNQYSGKKVFRYKRIASWY